MAVLVVFLKTIWLIKLICMPSFNNGFKTVCYEDLNVEISAFNPIRGVAKFPFICSRVNMAGMPDYYREIYMCYFPSLYGLSMLTIISIVLQF